LIGCAIKAYDNQEAIKAAASLKPPIPDHISLHESTATDYITPLTSAKTNTQLRNPSSKTEKDHHSRTTSSKNDIIREEEEKKPQHETEKPLEAGNAQEVATLEEDKNDPDRLENEFKNWIERNSLFFNGKFFPAAEKFLVITQLVNRNL
jgi:hypothetical protein